MIQKPEEKKQAIRLRKAGHSYNKILEQVSVSKSTLSLWLRDVGLSKRQEQRITELKILAQKRGSQGQHQKRIKITKQIKDKARSEISTLSPRDLWLIGTMLYWGEGVKQKDHIPQSRSAAVELINSDPILINIYLKWLENCCKVDKGDLGYSVYIHEKASNRGRAINYWRHELNLDKNQKITLHYKKHNPKTVRKNTNEHYFGSCKVWVRKSTNLNRRIAGWMEGIAEKI